MLANFAKRMMSGPMLTPMRFGFSGGHHHEIDYQAVVTKNEKSGRRSVTKDTT